MVPTKCCPACSERVRETARRCQFCLFQFDVKSSLLSRLVARFRRPRVRPPVELPAGAFTTLRGYHAG